MSSQSSEPTRSYKVVIIGDQDVGKTTLTQTFCGENYRPQALENLNIEIQSEHFALNNETYSLVIWVVDGQRYASSIREIIYQGAHAAALVYDVTSPATFLNLMHWRDQAQSAVPLLPMIVVGNKSDLDDIVPLGEAHGWANSLRMEFILTSALNGENVRLLFTQLAYMAQNEAKRRAERQKQRMAILEFLQAAQKFTTQN